MKYKELKNYKYELVETYETKINILPMVDIYEPEKENAYLKLSREGILTIFRGYAWDGASGTTIDTKNFMRGSLVHDALYQLMRQSKISMEHREYADKLLYDICRDDGMSSFRASYVLKAVRLFGESSASPTEKKEIQIKEAP